MARGFRCGCLVSCINGLVDDLSVRNKKAAFRRETGTRKAVHVTYVTTFGLVRNAYANSVQSEVTLDDLFRA